MNLWLDIKHSNISITGVPKGEEEEQEIEHLFENIIKENFPSLAKEIDIQPGSKESSKQEGHKDAHTKTHHN